MTSQPLFCFSVLWTGCWLALPASSADVVARVALVSGEHVSARFVAIEPDWSVTLAIGQQTRKLPMSEIIHWGNYRDNPAKTKVLLIDGSTLVGDVVHVADESLLIETELWGQVHVERRTVRGLLFAPASMPLQRDRQRERIKQPSSQQALLLLRNRDQVVGKLVGHEPTEDELLYGIESIAFVPDGGDETTFATRDLELIAFKPADPPSEPAQARLGFGDGSYVVASQVKATGNTIAIISACGVSLPSVRPRFAQHLTSIESERTEATFVSDLDAVGYKAFPYLSVEWPLGVDQNVLGGRLRCQGSVCSKGLGMHATSRVVYNLESKYSRFEAEIGLDDQAGQRGSVIYRVFVERPAGASQKWALAYTSPIVRGGEEPRAISVDVAAATRMALAVEIADAGDTLDHANWLYARLIPLNEASTQE